MKVIFQVPHLNTIYAGRTIYSGYQMAWEDLGHEFKFFTAQEDQKTLFENFEPDIFVTSLHSYNLKYLDLELLKKARRKGVKVFVSMPFWRSPLSKLRVNEAPSLRENSAHVNLIKTREYGDVYYNVCEPEDFRMEGFEKETGYKHTTMPLAANKLLHFHEFSEKFKSDISFLGTYLPDKKEFMEERLFPLKKKYNLKLFGQDWTTYQRMIGIAKKGGQYFNIPILKGIQKAKLQLEDERRIYSTATISLNIHEEYQRKYGGDANARTFVIPICEGFEITDDVASIRKYFEEDKEIVIAKDKGDWFDKIDYYIKNPEKRLPIIKAGKEKVLREHTYHNRVDKFVEIFNTLV